MTEVELVGNALCLDFTNTVNARPVAQRDWLDTPAGLRLWAGAVGLPLGEDGDHLARQLPHARVVRETIYRVFAPLTRRDRSPQPDLDVLTRWYAEAVRVARLRPYAGRFGLTWPQPRDLAALLGEVTASAVELLTHGPLDRLGACPNCGWLFLDTSKNRRRRWCSMATCGSREKARRYYATHAAESPSPMDSPVHPKE